MRIGSWPEPWRRGPVLAVLALLLGLFMLLHPHIPNRTGNAGSLVETFLPWTGLPIPALAAATLWRRSPTAAVALLLPAAVWLHLFTATLTDKTRPGGDLTLAGHNLGAANPDPTGTARTLTATGADLLALQELTPQARPAYEKALAHTYPHHTVQGTVGLWSKLPLTHIRPVDIQMDHGPLAATKAPETKQAYNRALRATVTTPHGPLAVYVAHLGSARLTPRTGFWTTHRNRNAHALAHTIATEPNQRVVLLGDLNATTHDRALHPLTTQLHSTQDTTGDGFGFTWPATLPVARIDHILVRGVQPKSSWVLPATGSDHRPVAARITW
ncbi:endonuclease/exonuclease/phosphatase family protein [Actinomadura sp. 21ATH]|uniref:endonuclease/exonuclease/phosphatase family protein n=1 Tax=Actinomadura sp. 21ATH TaxID=1735444 RepID=UPI0035C1C8CC